MNGEINLALSEDTQEEITKPPLNINKDDLLDKINDYFQESELKNLESYYEKRIDEVNSLMFKLYDYTKEVETLKLQMPIIKPPQAGKFIKKMGGSGDTLYGGSSTMSRRSNSSSSSRSFGTRAFGAKPKFGAQKVSINIGGDLDEDNKMNSSIMRRGVKSTDSKLNALKHDLSGGAKSKIANPVNPVLSSLQNRLKTETSSKERTNKLIEAAKSKALPNGKKIPNGGSNLLTSESDKDVTPPSSALKTKSSKPIMISSNQKPTTHGAPLKKSEIINKVKSNSSSTVETENPKSFKFEPKKKPSNNILLGR